MRANTIVVTALAGVLCATATAATRYSQSSPVPGELVVADLVSGLMWQGCAAGSSGDTCATGSATGMAWQASLVYCEGLTWSGYGDWRLPDSNELQSIVDYRRYTPAIDIAAFPATPAAWFWSSSSYADDAGYAWSVSFGPSAVYDAGNGNVGSNSKSLDYHVRCVRSGP